MVTVARVAAVSSGSLAGSIEAINDRNPNECKRNCGRCFCNNWLVTALIKQTRAMWIDV